MRKVFAFKNYEVVGSTSGGAFPTIVKTISRQTEKEIVIYGAIFDNNLNVIHKRFVGLEGLSEIQGSKYVQSKVGDCYKQVYDDLKENAVVVFSGTPCQVYGLKKFLGTKDIKVDDLYLVDIICHGTALPLLWTKYKEWLEKKYKRKLKAFSFRYQESRGAAYSSMALFEDGKKIVNTYNIQLYNRLFLSNVALRDGCYKCPFAKVERCSDITIGDFWGIEKLVPEFGEKHKVSQILANTQRGQMIVKQFEELPDKIKLLEYKKDDYLLYQRQLNRPTVEPAHAKAFKRDLELISFDKVIKKYMHYGIISKLKFGVKKSFAILRK